MIVVTVFEPNGISIWFKKFHHDHIPFTVKGNGNIVFSVYATAAIQNKPHGVDWVLALDSYFPTAIHIYNSL